MDLMWQPADSRAMAEVAYDEGEEAIYIRFNQGAVWRYDACPPHVWEEFNSQSKGKYLNDVLKFKPSRQA